MWDVTCPDTLAPSYLSIATAEAGAVAREAEHRKQVKYSHLEDSHYFVPIAIETLGAMGHKARSFLKELAQRIHLATEDNQAYHHYSASFSGSPEGKRGGSSWVHWGGSCVMTLGLVAFFVVVFVIIIVEFFFLSRVCSVYSSSFYF